MHKYLSCPLSFVPVPLDIYTSGIVWCLLFIDYHCQKGWCELAHPVSTLEFNCRPKTCLASASTSALSFLRGRLCTCPASEQNPDPNLCLSTYLAWIGLRLLQISPLRDISSTTTFESLWTDSQQCGQKMLDLGAQACCWSWLYPMSKLLALDHAGELSPANLPVPKGQTTPWSHCLGGHDLALAWGLTVAAAFLHMGLGDVKEEGFPCVFYQPSMFNICNSPVCALSICLCREARRYLIPFRWMGRGEVRLYLIELCLQSWL